MDSVSKRQTVLALFIALQSWKLYDWLISLPMSLKTSAGSDVLDDLLAFFFKWAALELGFLAALHVARVPKMDWSLGTRAAVWGGMCCVTLGMAFFAPAMSGNQSTLVDDKAIAQPIPDLHGNLMGEFTVKVKPWAVAKLNPDRLRQCLATSTAPPNSQGLSDATKRPIISEEDPVALIPLALSGTAPWTVVWEWGSGLTYRQQFSMEEHHTEVFTEAKSQIKAKRLGYYRIVSILDGNGSPGRIGKDSAEMVQVLPCPEARFDGLAILGGVEVCVGRKAKFPLKVWLSDATNAPFDLTLTRFSGDTSKSLAFPGLEPQIAFVEGISKSGRFFLAELDMLDFDTPGEHLIRVESVRDAHGSEKRYGTWDMGDSVLVTASAPPTASFKHGVTPPALLEGGSSSAMVHVELKGKGPFTLAYDLYDLDNPANRLRSQSITTSETTFAFEAKEPGIYKLASVSDQLCEGTLLDDQIKVTLVKRPSASIDFRPIKSPCQGDLGAIFDFDLGGHGPWELHMEETSAGDDTLRKRKVRIDTGKYSFKWIPEVPGRYAVRFTGISDAAYSEPIPLTEARMYELNILPAPNAKFVKVPAQSVYTCVGSREEPLLVEIKVSGIGPWTLEGQLETPNGREPLKWTVPAGKPTLAYKFPAPSEAGRMTMKLLTVADDKGCTSPVEGQAVTVNVLPILPSAKFDIDHVDSRYDVPTKLPFKLSGNKGPWTVELRHTGKDGKGRTEEIQLDSISSAYHVQKEGLYEILSVRDQYCRGVVGEDQVVRVSFLPMPRASFAPKLAKSTCKQRGNSVAVVINDASGPVALKYTEQFGHDMKKCTLRKPIEKTLSIPSGRTAAEIPIDTQRIPGFYRYAIASVSDDSYKDVKVSGEAFVQQVLPDPAPRIISETSTILHCQASSMSDAKLRLDFSSSSTSPEISLLMSPWLVSYDVLDGKYGAVIASSSVETKDGLIQLVDIKKAGTYMVRVTKVSSKKTGCTWVSPDNLSLEQCVAAGYAIPLTVIMMPSLKLLGNGSDYGCIGDTVTFELGGSGPWTIKYTLARLDGTSTSKTETITHTGPNGEGKYGIRLTEPGTLRLTSLSNPKCSLAPSSLPSPLAVKPLPTASIEAGNQWVHEDEIASFKVRLGGTPPFTFSYQRLDETNRAVVLDSQTIARVQGHEYTVEIPGLGGTFRIESVQDKYCRYPPKSSS